MIFFFYSRGFVFISRFLQWVCLILNETKPTYDTIGDWAISVGPFCAKGKCKAQSAGSAVDVGCHCRDRKVFIFLCQFSNGSRVLTQGPRWRVGALRRLQVKSPFVAILGQKKKHPDQMKETFFHLFPKSVPAAASLLVASSFLLSACAHTISSAADAEW